MQPKPRHLEPEYGAQFRDESIARRYDTRPAYPPATFDLLEGLLAPGERVVLELGCRTGDAGFLAIVEGRTLINVPWWDALLELLPRYSTNRDFRPYDLIQELCQRGLFSEHGRSTTTPVPAAQSLADYVESFHTRNGFSRERMAPEAAADFDEAVRSLVLSHSPDGLVRGEVAATVVWGFPSGG